MIKFHAKCQYYFLSLQKHVTALPLLHQRTVASATHNVSCIYCVNMHMQKTLSQNLIRANLIEQTGPEVLGLIIYLALFQMTLNWRSSN